MTCRLETLQKQAAMKIVAELPEDQKAALAILDIAKQLVQWKPGDGED